MVGAKTPFTEVPPLWMAGNHGCMHALGKTEHRLCQCVEPTDLLGREFDLKRLHIILELGEPPGTNDSRG